MCVMAGVRLAEFINFDLSVLHSVIFELAICCGTGAE